MVQHAAVATSRERDCTQLVLPLEGAYGLLLPEVGRREGHDRTRALHAVILGLEGLSNEEVAEALNYHRQTVSKDHKRVAYALRAALRTVGLPEPPGPAPASAEIGD